MIDDSQQLLFWEGCQLQVERAVSSAFGYSCICSCLCNKLAPVLTLEPNKKRRYCQRKISFCFVVPEVN